MSEAFNNSSIDTELQVRLMNLVMGEASDFERDQLQLLMEQRSELASYYQHLEHLHGLLCEVGAGEPTIEFASSTIDHAWQLSAKRREQVLAVLDNQLPNLPDKVALASRSELKARRRTYAKVVVVALTACGLLIGLMLPAVQSARLSARKNGMHDFRRGTSDVKNNASGRVEPELKSDRTRQQAGLGGASNLGSEIANANRNELMPNKFLIDPRSGSPSVADNESFENQVERIAEVPAMPRFSQSFDNGQVSRHGTTVESPKPEGAWWERVDSDWDVTTPENTAKIPMPSLSYGNGVQADKLTVPDGGEILLGGIRKTRELAGQGVYFDDNLSDDIYGLSSLMEPVTPRIIIQEEEEVGQGNYPEYLLPVSPVDGESQTDGPLAGEWQAGLALKKTEQAAQVTEPLVRESKGKLAEDALGWRTNTQQDTEDAQPDGLGDLSQGLETARGVAPELALQWNADFSSHFHDADSAGSEPSANGETRRIADSQLFSENQARGFAWQYAPAPSPEIASTARTGINANGKLANRQPSVTLDEQSAAAEAFSTFSLHVSDVSFQLARTALSQGQWPEAASIRIEEFVNALDYHDPLPSGHQQVACRVEQAIHPFLMQRNLLRVSMRTAATGRSQTTPLRLTLLLDNSGSMERPDRHQAVLHAFETLTQQLSADDQITLISFASTPRLLADKIPGNQGQPLLQLVENLPAEGGTNIEAALLLAREKAMEQQLAGAQNRIVLLTDGAVNLGNANPDSLAQLVTQMRDSGIAFDAAGISALDLNDEVLEALTRQGDGRYYLLDSTVAASESFAAQIAGALRPSAQNVKVQVEFNPQRVGRYKLLGFEKHRLNNEDFRNDQVDAAEMAAAEAGVAVYQFEIKPNGSGDVGSVSVRFRDLSTGQMVERRWPIPYDSNAPRLEQAESSMQLAASAALFAAKLGGGALADSIDLETLQHLLAKLPAEVTNQARVQQLRTMIDQAGAIAH